MSAGSFRGGRKPFPKPSAFESEIHPPHKPSVYAPGISPLQGANLRLRKFIIQKRRTVFIPASNEPSSRARADIWRMPRGSNTPPLGAGRTS